MSFDGDPYRTLGLPRGASLDEVKRAYRQLAKQFHPDSAGERALPRFLAIQAAYEQLAGPLRGTGFRPAPRPADARSAPPRRPPAGPTWEADPARARATRDAYRRNGAGGGRGAADEDGAPRPRGGSTSRPAGGATTGAPGTTSSGAGASWTGTRRGRHADDAGAPETPGRAGRPTGGGATGTDGATSGERSTGGAADRGSRRRPSRKATLGSTSYDEAAAPFEATWEGGTWYGASSGTYWTINPKEYADPRKHGPEYLARARRARGPNAGVDPGVESAAVDADPDDERQPADDVRDERPREREGVATADFAAEGLGPERGPGANRRNGRRRSTDGATRSGWSAAPAGQTEPIAAASQGRGVEAEAGVPPVGTLGQRVLFALVGWPPIGLAIAGLYGELTGCGRFAATCTRPDEGPFGLAMWLVQLAVLAALLAVPRAARAATAGTVALLAAAIPSAVLLSAIGGARDPQTAATTLVAMLGAAWLAGVALDASGRFAPLTVRWGRVR